MFQLRTIRTQLYGLKNNKIIFSERFRSFIFPLDGTLSIPTTMSECEP